ncbi:rho-related GTP-binding protein RhoD isoform X2 [Grus americana]|uniref:rho-related GTP-binding protein RhoD isoform X2 n=1 Tax=Grus americana TaxID=9117 RepID=UPI0024083FAD|nr:rho-related GTP-binding protein RhoD isoform X2 [Grus americana]
MRVQGAVCVKERPWAPCPPACAAPAATTGTVPALTGAAGGSGGRGPHPGPGRCLLSPCPRHRRGQAGSVAPPAAPMQQECGGQSPGPPEDEVKAVIVGDGGCGKTSLLMAFTRRDFLKAYTPTVFEKYTASLQVGSKPVKIHLWDTAGQEDYDRLRPLSYSNTNVVLICFDVTSPNSYDNILTKWYPEVNHFCKGIPVLLVGCKTDLRQDQEVLHKLQEGRLEPISYRQGEAMARQIHAVSYLECSARYQENIGDIFTAACSAAFSATHRRRRRRQRKRGCVLC